MLLQGVDIFHFCGVEEIVRIASIAELVDFSANEEVFSASDRAEAIYCVVDGRVRLRPTSAEGDGTPAERAIESGEAFGVLEILSGRLRQSSAWAEVDTRALVIGVDAFFDLLSHNIDIVKALFREVLDERKSANGVGLA